MSKVSDHIGHKWARKNRCVYCTECCERLYQGYMPTKGRQAETAKALDIIFDFILELTPEQRAGLQARRSSPPQA